MESDTWVETHWSDQTHTHLFLSRLFNNHRRKPYLGDFISFKINKRDRDRPEQRERGCKVISFKIKETDTDQNKEKGCKVISFKIKETDTDQNKEKGCKVISLKINKRDRDRPEQRERMQGDFIENKQERQRQTRTKRKRMHPARVTARGFTCDTLSPCSQPHRYCLLLDSISSQQNAMHISGMDLLR